MKNASTKLSIESILFAILFILFGIGLAAAGIYVGETDDAPGAALLGLLLMTGCVIFALRTLQKGRKAVKEDQKS